MTDATVTLYTQTVTLLGDKVTLPFRHRNALSGNAITTIIQQAVEKHIPAIFFDNPSNNRGDMTTDHRDIWDCRFVNLLLEAMADGVFTLDIEGKISSWNRSMERITGYAPDEAIGRACGLLGFNLCFGKSCPANPEACGIYRNETVEMKECMLRHKNGHNVPVLKNARVVKEEGRILGVVETVTDMTELKNARRQAEAANLKLAEVHRLDNLIGKSRPMREVFSAIKAAAASEATILIEGESGTGKELAAGAIHYNSSRSDQPLITVNCSALSESILESELFGHVKGAFTGAIRDRVGRFEEADGGTIFLDEIGEISPLIQVKLLRVLQEREIERVGESKKRKIDLRFISGTHQDLYALVKAGKFREDLYYRLKVFPISLPPLRQRKEDIPMLVNHFIRRQNEITGKTIIGLSHSAIRILMDYFWPGNVRELENAIEHAFVLCRRDEIDVFDLPVEIRRTEYYPHDPYPASVASPNPQKPSDRLTRDKLLILLKDSDWNKAEVARRLNLSRTSVWKYMKKWDIPLKPPA